MRTEYAIITRKDEIEEGIYGHKFVTGLNVCPHNGLFHVHLTATIHKRLPVYVDDTYIRFVSFPSDAKFLYPHPANPYFTVKADKIILSERLPLGEFITADMIKERYVCLEHIPRERRTTQMYEDAIKGGAYFWLKEMPVQTWDACMAAVMIDPDALRLIRDPTVAAAASEKLTSLGERT